MKTNDSKKRPQESLRRRPKSNGVGKPSSVRSRRHNTRVRYVSTTVHFYIELVSGYEVTIPIEKLEELKGATRRQLAAVRIASDGSALEQRELDVDISMPGPLREVTGQSAIQRLAGATKSPAKVAAARSNGAKGGRPKKPQKN